MMQTGLSKITGTGRNVLYLTLHISNDIIFNTKYLGECFMINILFCDDNTEFLSILFGYVRDIIQNDYRNIFKDAKFYSYDNGKGVISFAERERVDVIFLDIDMNDRTGFEVAKQLLEINGETLIVFVSAYDQFVYDAFEFYPIAFLRKGKVCDELPKTMKRICGILNEPNEMITVTATDGKINIRKKDIVYIHSIGNYCYYVLSNGKQYSCRDTLGNVEKAVAEYDFYRVHAAYIVNLEQIQSIDRSISVIMGKDNVPIPIAQRRLMGFKKAYAEFLSRRII